MESLRDSCRRHQARKDEPIAQTQQVNALLEALPQDAIAHPHEAQLRERPAKHRGQVEQIEMVCPGKFPELLIDGGDLGAGKEQRAGRSGPRVVGSRKARRGGISHDL